MGSRDRPQKEVKKKPKDKSTQPKLAPLSEPPQQVEVIRKQAQAALGRGSPARADASGGRGPGPAPSSRQQPHRSEDRHDDHRQGAGRRATARNGEQGRRGARAGRRRGHPRDREAVRPRLDHEARLGASGSRSTSIPTGSIALDLALGVGGIPRGRITEIFGPESSGKTTLCQHVIAEAQREGGVAAFIDVEHALDPGYARACGVNVDELLVSQPDTGEQALEITETLIRSGGVDFVVVDSVAALVPRAEIEGEMGDSLRRHPGPADEPGAAQADRRGQPLEHRARLHQPAAREDRRHVRQPGDDARRPRAEVLRQSSASTSGASRRSRPAPSRSATGSASRSSRTRSRRRSASPSSTSCTARASRSEGGLLDVGVAMDVVTKTGAWFTFGETRLGQGREASKEFLKGERRHRRPRSTAGSAPRSPRWRSRSRASKRPSSAAAADDRPSRVRRKPTIARAPRSPRRRSRIRSRGPRRGARFLEARPRCIAEVRRRLTPLGYRAPLVDDAVTRMARARLSRRRGVRARLGRVARPGAAAWRARLAARAALKGVDRSIIDAVLEERRAEAATTDVPAGHDGLGADDLAAERLLRRKLGPILRENDPRKRRQRAYALLARSGFAPDVCSTATKRVLDDPATTASDADPGLDETDLTDG